jgi:peroxiredoxin
MAQQLEPGDTFPELVLQSAGGDTITLPADIDTPYAVILFYRGHW